MQTEPAGSGKKHARKHARRETERDTDTYSTMLGQDLDPRWWKALFSSVSTLCFSSTPQRNAVGWRQSGRETRGRKGDQNEWGLRLASDSPLPDPKSLPSLAVWQLRVWDRYWTQETCLNTSSGSNEVEGEAGTWWWCGGLGQGGAQ